LFPTAEVVVDFDWDWILLVQDGVNREELEMVDVVDVTEAAAGVDVEKDSRR